MNPDDKEMEKLSKAIVEAILGSDDVKKALHKVQNIEFESPNSFMVFVVKLDSLADVKGKLKKADITEIKPKKPKARKKKDISDVIDGRVLSKNEEKFLHYIAENFDQKDWLKKLKISLG